MQVSQASSPTYTNLGPNNYYVLKNEESSYLGVPSPGLWGLDANELWWSHCLSIQICCHRPLSSAL